MNIQSLFRPLEALESNLSVLYKVWSGHFATDAEASILFYKMGLEEKAHLALLQYQKRLVRQNPDHFEDLSVDLDEIQAITHQVEGLLRARTGPSLEEAVGQSLDIEQGAAECHYKTAFVAARPAMAALIKCLAAGDRQHLEGLRNFAKARGYEKLLSKPLPRFPNL